MEFKFKCWTTPQAVWFLPVYSLKAIVFSSTERSIVNLRVVKAKIFEWVREVTRRKKGFKKL